METTQSAEPEVRSAAAHGCPFCETFREDIQRLQAAFTEARSAANQPSNDDTSSSAAARSSDLHRLRAEHDALQREYASHLESHAKLLTAQRVLQEQQEGSSGGKGEGRPAIHVSSTPVPSGNASGLDSESRSSRSPVSSTGVSAARGAGIGARGVAGGASSLPPYMASLQSDSALGSPLQPRHLAALPTGSSPGRSLSSAAAGPHSASLPPMSPPGAGAGAAGGALVVPPPPFNSGWLRTCALADEKSGRRKASAEFFALGTTLEQQPVPVPVLPHGSSPVPPPSSGPPGMPTGAASAGDAAWRQGEAPALYSAVDITAGDSLPEPVPQSPNPAPPHNSNGSSSKRGGSAAISTVNSGSGFGGTRQLFGYSLHAAKATSSSSSSSSSRSGTPGRAGSMTSLSALTAAAASSFTPLHTYHLRDALKHVRVLCQEEAEEDLLCAVVRLLHSHAQAGITHLPDTIWTPLKHRLEALLRGAGESADLSYAVWVASSPAAAARTKSLLAELLQRESLVLEQVLLALTACRAVPLASFSLHHELSVRDVRVLHILLRASGVHYTRRARAHTDVPSSGGAVGGGGGAHSGSTGGGAVHMLGGAGGGHAGLGAPLGHALSPNVPVLHLHLSLPPPPALSEGGAHGQGSGATAAIRQWVEAHGMHWPFGGGSSGKRRAGARGRASSVNDVISRSGSGEGVGGMAGGPNSVSRSNSQQGITADMAPDAQRIVGAECGTLLYRVMHSDIHPLEAVQQVLHAGADLGKAWYALAAPLAMQGGGAGVGVGGSSLSPSLAALSGGGGPYGDQGSGGFGLGLGAGAGSSAAVVTKWEETHLLHVAAALDHALLRWSGGAGGAGGGSGPSLTFLSHSASTTSSSSSGGGAAQGGGSSSAAASGGGGGEGLSLSLSLSSSSSPMSLQQAVTGLLRTVLRHDPFYLFSEPCLVDAMIASLLCGVQAVYLASGQGGQGGMAGGGGSSITSISSHGSYGGSHVMAASHSTEAFVEARLAVIQCLLSSARRMYKRQVLLSQLSVLEKTETEAGVGAGGTQLPRSSTTGGPAAAAAAGGGGGPVSAALLLEELQRLDTENEEEALEEEEGGGVMGPLANWRGTPSDIPTPHAEEAPGTAPLAMLSVTKRRGSILAGGPAGGGTGAGVQQPPVHMHLAGMGGGGGRGVEGGGPHRHHHSGGMGGGMPEGPTADFSAHAHTACLCRHHDVHAPLRALLCPPWPVPEGITQRCLDCLLSNGYPVFTHPQLALGGLGGSGGASTPVLSEAGLPQWRLAALDPRCTFLRVGLLGSRQLSPLALCTVLVPVAEGMAATVLELLCHAGNITGVHLLLDALRPEHIRSLSAHAAEQLRATLSLCVEALQRALADQKMGAGSRGMYVDWSAVAAAQARAVQMGALQLDASAGLHLVDCLLQLQGEVQQHAEALQQAVAGEY